MGYIYSCHKYLLSISNVLDAILLTGDAEMDYTDAVGALHSKGEKHTHFFPAPITY